MKVTLIGKVISFSKDKLEDMDVSLKKEGEQVVAINFSTYLLPNQTK